LRFFGSYGCHVGFSRGQRNSLQASSGKPIARSCDGILRRDFEKNVFVAIFHLFVLQSVKSPAPNRLKYAFMRILLKGNFIHQTNIDILCTACLALRSSLRLLV
jgi:hypothetical protein